MKCELHHKPEAFGYCSRWEGRNGMTAMPAVGNICEYCLHYIEGDEDE